MLKWAVGQRRSESSCCGPPPKRTRRCSAGKENSNEWEAGSRESLFTRLEPSALRDVSNYHRLGETPPRTPDQKRLSLKRRKSAERVLEWVETPEPKRQARLSHDPVRSLLQIEFSPLLPLLSPSPVELDHKDIPLAEDHKPTTPRLPSTVSPLARRLNYLKLGGKVRESPWPADQLCDSIAAGGRTETVRCCRLRTPPSGTLEESLAFLDSVREPDPPSTLRRMKSIRRPRRQHPISALTLPTGEPSPFESPAVLARLRHPTFRSRPEDRLRQPSLHSLPEELASPFESPARLRQPSILTLPEGLASPFESPTALARLRQSSVLSLPEEDPSPTVLARPRQPSILTLPEGLASPFESPTALARLRQSSVLSLPEDDPSPTALARLRQPSILTLPEGLASPFDSPAGLARLRQTSILTLPEGIPSPASPFPQPLSDTSTTSSNKISDEDDAVSNLGSAEQSPCPVVEEKSRSRRCLTFTSPVRKRPRRTLSLRQQGELELSINYDSPALTIHVIKGKSLQPLSGSGTCNAYIKVSLVPTGEERAFHRTCVRKDSANPRFDTKFVLALAEEDLQRRILVSAWHRDRRNRKSEFLGCMSFAVKHAIKRDISGSFRLLSQSCGRIKNVPTMTNSENIWHQHTDVMANQSESSVEELLSVDESDIGPPNDTPGVKDRRKLKSFKKDTERVHEDQIFLRHLELDPPEEEGNKSGRTPFTSTRTLVRQPGTSFGFSIAWTHPPRVERVEAGLPADQAGLRPGDYVIFVGKTNVVTLQEDEILQLIKSYGDRVVFEVYRKVSGNGMRASTGLLTQPRPSTACSGATTATSIDRRKLHLPQVTFTTEQGHGSEEETRKKSVYQLLGREQQYALCMQFGIARFLVPLAERKDIISQADHAVLFQNIQESSHEYLPNGVLVSQPFLRFREWIPLQLLRHTEDILELYVQDETLGLSLGRIYYKKMNALNNSYRRYCIGLKKADCILVEKTRNPNFMKLITEPPIPKRRPDLTTFIHKPLEHFREVLKLLQTALNSTKVKDDDSLALAKVIQEMQATYRDITVESGLMEPDGEGRPLLSLQDLESRLVFTRCKPFVLSSPGRQWIFGGDLSRVEGRSIRPFWALLFSDLLLFAKVSRDRVIFVTEDPLPLNTISQALFSIRKKATEFRLLISSGPAGAESPAVGGCADLRGTPRKGPRRRTIALRAPTPELKAVWQNLIQRQIIYVNTARGGTPASSPMDSPDPLTAESLESVSIKRQEPKPVTVTELIEHRCRQLGKTGMSKGSALHLSLWMRGQLGEEGSPEALSEPEPWSPETMRRRAREIGTTRHSLSRCQPIDLSDHSSDDSQKTVRSFSGNSEKVMAVCRKCHKTCLLNNNNSLKKSDTRRIDINANCPKSEGFSDDWGESSTSALSPTDPFLPVPHISVQPATPLNNNFSWGAAEQNNSSFDCDKDGAESDGEVPYRSLSPTGLKRYGTVSSLEKLEGEDSDLEAEEIPQDYPAQYETVGQSIRGWTVRAGTYVVEKMAFLERIGEDSRGVSFIERYLRTNPDSKHSEELIATSTSLAGEEECETSGATSGEEIWGTPTSGDSGVTSPNNEDSIQHYEATLLGTAFDDAREQLMMDKLLSGVSVMGSLVPLCPVSRGFPQRRRLDPLPEDEEESSDSSSSEEATKSYSTDQGNKSDSCAAKAKSASSTPHRFFNRLKLRRSHSADSKTARQSKIMELLRGSKSEEHTSSSRGSRLSRLFSRDSQDDIPTTLPPDVIQKREHDKNFEKRFWKQLRKRRLSGGGSSPKPPFAST